MEANTPKSNRTYKARLFALIFSEKEECLKLYNAVNGTDYRDPDMLELDTLQDAGGLCGVHGRGSEKQRNHADRAGGGHGN